MPYADPDLRRHSHRQSDTRKANAQLTDPAAQADYLASLAKLRQVIRTRPPADGMKGIAIAAIDLAAAHPAADMRGQLAALKLAAETQARLMPSRSGRPAADPAAKPPPARLRKVAG